MKGLSKHGTRTKEYTYRKLIERNSKTIFIRSTSTVEIWKVIKKLKDNSEGIDNISAKTLKAISHSTAIFLIENKELDYKSKKVLKKKLKREFRKELYMVHYFLYYNTLMI